MADSSRDYAAVVQAEGADFLGVEFGPHGAVILFADPQSRRSTLALPESEFSPQAVSRCLQESRRAYDLDAHVQKSLC
jgi:hypothetical protein